MPPVIRKTERMADGSKRMTGMSMQSPASICPMCKKIVKRLYEHKRGQIVVKLCGECKEKF